MTENKLVEEHSSQGEGLEKRGASLDLEAVLRMITPVTACNYSGFILSACLLEALIMHRGLGSCSAITTLQSTVQLAMLGSTQVIKKSVCTNF